MSGDPMTMAIIANTAFTVAGTYSEIQDAKYQAKVQKTQYENESCQNGKEFCQILLG